MWAISVDPGADSRQFTDKIAADGKGRLAFPLLADTGHRVIDAYGLQDPRYLAQKREGIPWPTVYVIDKSGRVAWAKIEKDHTQRPSNADIRAAIDSLK